MRKLKHRLELLQEEAKEAREEGNYDWITRVNSEIENLHKQLRDIETGWRRELAERKAEIGEKRDCCSHSTVDRYSQQHGRLQ